MAVKDASKNVKVGVNLITIAAFDSLISDLSKLKLDQDSYQAVHALIESKKDECVFDVKKKKKDSSEKRTVPTDRQCKYSTNGKKCSAFISDKDIGLCWMHMDEKQKKHYRDKKEKAKAKK